METNISKNPRVDLVGTQLLENRIIPVFGEINDELAEEVIKKIIYLNIMDRDKEILLLISSTGGYLQSGTAMIDAILGSHCKIVTVILGKAYSMAGYIAVCGYKRYITPLSWFMAHDISGSHDDYVNKIKYHVKATEEMRDQLDNLYKDRTRLTEEDLKLIINGELWFNAKQCIDKGVVDDYFYNIK